jgi:hypothetical protein
MEVGQGPNVGCSAKEKKSNYSLQILEFVSYNFINFRQITFYSTKNLSLKV